VRTLVFTATYNEADNIRPLVGEICAQLPEAELLVVDDSSPDGTGRLVDELHARDPRIHVIHRPAKNGIGTAHKIAFKYALAGGYDRLITMDADFSHDPKYLPEMVRQLADAEFVIGSRYMQGGSLEYPPSRVVLSRAANFLTRTLLRIPLAETTTSYRGFTHALLERLDIDAIQSEGYSFFVESIYQVARLGLPMAEFPIHFADRRAGQTKISRKEIWRGVTTLGRLAAKDAGRRLGLHREDPLGTSATHEKCVTCGSEFFSRSVAGVVCLGCGHLG
jgi:dolichol-phosphate mannosyltransferase